jgi:hypothetical protein
MATTTPNFGWAVPTSTDLVKDGAVAIETLGDSIDASLVDLKGGTTGQVLAKASGTDMDFTWVAQDDSNAIQNAIVDAKGDLIAATAADTPARLAVGTNGQVLTADSTAATGLAWATAAGSSGPAFRAWLSADQTVTGSTSTKVQYNTENFDTDSCYDPTTNYRFTPNKAGYYEVTAQFLFVTAGAFGQISIIKNGGAATSAHRDAGQEGVGYAAVTDLISMNGTTDYLEVFAYLQNGAGTEQILGYTDASFFNAVWIRSN